MRHSAKKGVFCSLLGLLLALATPLGADAQADWPTSPGSQRPYQEGGFAQAVQPSPGADAHRPPDTMIGLQGSPASGVVDTGVVRATYDAPVQPAPARGEKPSHLPARGTPSTESGRFPGGLDRVWATGGALAFVLGLFLVVVWGLRRAAPKATLPLPSDVVEVLGRAPLAHRQHVHLVRCGNKLLLVSVRPEGAETLTEITDPVEVDRLAGLCRQSRPGSPTAAFRQIFDQFSHSNRQRPVTEEATSTGLLFPDDRAGALEEPYV